MGSRLTCEEVQAHVRGCERCAIVRDAALPSEPSDAAVEAARREHHRWGAGEIPEGITMAMLCAAYAAERGRR